MKKTINSLLVKEYKYTEKQKYLLGILLREYKVILSTLMKNCTECPGLCSLVVNTSI